MSDKKVFGNTGPVDPKLKRSTFDKSFLNNLTARPGYLYPVFVEECPANSSYSIDTDFAFDLMPMWYPVQNNIRAHLSFYRVPFRILMKHYKRFFGQIGKDGRINGSLNYEMPYIKRPAGWCKQGSLADYMGLPTNFYSEVDENVFLKRSNLHLVSEHRNRDTLLLSPLSANIQTSHVGLFFDARKGKISETATLKFSFIVDASVVVEDVLLFFETNNASFNLFKSSSYDEDGHYDVDLSIGVNSFTVTEGISYEVQGHSLKVLSLVLTLEPNDITEYNRLSKYYDNSGRWVLNWTDSLDGLAVATYLYKRNGEFSSVPLDASLLSITDKDDDFNSYEIKPNTSTYGLYGDVQLTMTIATNASRDHFSSINGSEPVIPINALPFRAYEMIYNYYYRNSRIDPFLKYSDETGNLQPCYDEFITNDADGADTTTPVELMRVPWEYDMFTTAVKEPFFGNAPLVGISTNKETGELNTATFTMQSTTGDTYSFDVRTNQQNKIVSIDYSSINGNTADAPVFNALNYAIECGISISDFRNANALTRWMEKQQRAGTKYQNLMEEFFGTRPPLGEEFPTYLGGVTRRIMINKIQNTAQSEGNPLGDFAGTGNVRGSSKRIRMFTSEPCYIIGLLYFSVTPLYSQMLPKHFIKSKLLDYYNPLFANISPQPIYTKQLAPLQLSAEEVDDVFGYGRPYADYVSRQDEVHGEFRGNMADFLFQRLFKEKPKLNKSFIEINSADLTNIFSNTEDNDKFFGQIFFSVRAKLPIPRFSVPQII